MRHPTLEVGTILLTLYGVMLRQSVADKKGGPLEGNEGHAHRALSTSSTAGSGVGYAPHVEDLHLVTKRPQSFKS